MERGERYYSAESGSEPEGSNAGSTFTLPTQNTKYRALSSFHPSRERYITLRVETCSNATGKFLGALFWIMTLGFIGYGISVIVLSRDSSAVESVPNGYFETNLIILGAVLAVLVGMCFFFAYRLHSAETGKGRVWRKWQRFLLWDARVVGGLSLVDMGSVVGSYGLYVGAECYPSAVGLAVLGFLRLLAFTAVVVWMTVTGLLMEVIVDNKNVDVSVEGGGDTDRLEGARGVAEDRVAAGELEAGNQKNDSNQKEEGKEQKTNSSSSSRIRLMVEHSWRYILVKRGVLLGLYSVCSLASLTHCESLRRDDRVAEQRHSCWRVNGSLLSRSSPTPSPLLDLFTTPISHLCFALVLSFVHQVYVAFAIVAVVLRVMGSDATLDSTTKVYNIPPKETCPADKVGTFDCSDDTTADIISYIMLSVILSVFWVFYIIAVRRAWKGQRDLPNARFRLTKLFLRIQMRYGRLLFFSLLFCGMVVELATIGTCRGRINSTLGSPAAHLSLGVYACTVLFLYAPGTGRSDAMTMFKSIAWREADVRDLLNELSAIEEGGETDVFEYLSGQLGIGKLSKLANMQENVGASVFCMEYCVKMFYFAWSAYKQGARRLFAAAGDTSYPFTVDKALRVFSSHTSATSFSEIYDEETDTYCIVVRSPDTIVLSFRGTASRKNAMTDLKIASTKYEPCPTLYGFPVLVHKGFWQAWNTVRRRIIDEVMNETVDGGVRRIFITGHSLGGALACLCSVELQVGFNERASAHGAESAIDVHTYTFGAPRVGNVAFGTYANTLLANYWHIVNTEDPVARIPKGLNYKRSGHQVLLGKNGNLEVYPSHFESSLFTNVGGKFTDHLMRTYGKRLGQFLKAQFVKDLTACNNEDEVEAVRHMATLLDAESLGLEGLLGCFLGDLEDGVFDLTLLPNVGATAPSPAPSPPLSRPPSSSLSAKFCLLPQSTTTSSKSQKKEENDSVDIELGARTTSMGSVGTESWEEAEEAAEADIDFREGIDDKVLGVLKSWWGE